MKEIYFAGGCFWGAQHLFEQVKGVKETETGFANGNSENPTYEEVYTDKTGFAETVRVVYDENIVSLRRLLDFFFMAIDPTSLNKQGEDEGTRYRTGVYASSEDDLAIVADFIVEKQKETDGEIVVEVELLRNYYPASEYHQHYLEKHPDGYCHLPWELFKKVHEESRK